MKKNRIKYYFSLANLGEETPKQVVKIQNIVDGLMIIITSATWVSASERYTLACAIAGYIINKAVSCLGVEDDQTFEGI